MGYYLIREIDRVCRTSATGGVNGVTRIVTAYIPILGVVALVSVLGLPG